MMGKARGQEAFEEEQTRGARVTWAVVLARGMPERSQSSEPGPEAIHLNLCCAP